MDTALTSKEHWDAAWGAEPRARVPSRLDAYMYDITRLLSGKVHRGGRVLEVGCAPGKMLLWLNARHDCEVCGVDYSPAGYAVTTRLFEKLGRKIDLRQEDFMATTFQPRTFDLVYSIGVVEHFIDPGPMIRKHVEMLRPGGFALVMVPSYGKSFVGWMQRKLHPENLAIHNVDMMSREALVSFVPSEKAKAYAYGRFYPAAVTYWHPWARWPANALAWLQPVTIPTLAPNLVLEVAR